MKLSIIAILLLGLSNLSFALDVRGAWYGECVDNGRSYEDGIYIRQDEKSISINDQTFRLGSTSSVEKQGLHEEAEWKEVTIYDWHWSEDKTYIKTNAKWLGWYLNQSGTWSGRGTGSIKLNGKDLEIQRDFEMEFGSSVSRISEICRYQRG